MLMKIKVLESSLLKPKDCGNELAEHTQAELIQTIGKMVVLFKRHPEKPIILLPFSLTRTKIVPISGNHGPDGQSIDNVDSPQRTRVLY